MEDLIKLINKGWDVKFWNQVKRMGGDWEVRVCWKAQFNDKTYECDWKGFKKSGNCIKNFVKFAKTIE